MGGTHLKFGHIDEAGNLVFYSLFNLTLGHKYVFYIKYVF